MLRQIVNAPWYIRNKDIHKDLRIDKLSNYVAKLNAKFYKKIPEASNQFNELLNAEMLREDKKFRPMAAFFTSDVTISKIFK